MIPTSQGERSPVKREGAERYMLLSLVSFALSVILTRLFLELAGYPQIATSELHIAHVLWGGLLLFVAALMPLVLANRWAFNASAIIGGVGVGLFIDEVGKFITQSNDYFYPFAAPIIYAFFLLTVLVYIRVRKPPTLTPRHELYRILEGLTEVLDHDLDANERAMLESRLHRIAEETEADNLKRLVDALIDYLEEEKMHLAEPVPTRWQQMGHKVAVLYERFMSPRRLKAFMIFSLGGMGVLAILDFIFLIGNYFQADLAFQTFLTPLVAHGDLTSEQEAVWFVVRVFLEGVTGVMLIASGGLIMVGKERTGIQTATMALLIWLTVINLLVFYFDQFGAVVTALAQFFVLLVLTYYRRRYLAIIPAT
jgi:hypothetical protein